MLKANDSIIKIHVNDSIEKETIKELSKKANKYLASNDPQQLEAILDLYKYSEEKQNELGLADACILFLWHYHSKKDYTKTIYYAIEALKYCDNKDTKEWISFKNNVANTLIHIGLCNKGVDLQKEVIEYKIKNKIGEGSYPQYYAVIGRNYLECNEPDSAVLYNILSLEYALKLDPNSMDVIKGYNNTGFSYYKAAQLDSAKKYYEEGLNILLSRENKNRGDSVFIGLMSGNLGNVFYDKGQIKKAVELIQTDLTYSIQCKQSESAFNAMTLLSEIKLEEGRCGEAMGILDLYKTFSTRRINDNQWAKLYKVYSEAHYCIGNFEKGKQFYDQYEELNEKLLQLIYVDRNKMEKEFINGMLRSELDEQGVLFDKSQQKVKLLSDNQRILKLRIYIIISITTFIVILILILFIRYRSNQRKKAELQRIQAKLHKSELSNMLIKKQMLEDELENKNNQLTNLALDITRKHNFTEKIIDQLNAIKKKYTGELMPNIIELIIFVKNEFNIDASRIKFNQEVNEVSQEFYKNLEEKHPDLTKTEKQLCGFIRINLTNKEIAILKNITYQSIKVAKNRLKKKMNLEAEQSLDRYLSEI